MVPIDQQEISYSGQVYHVPDLIDYVELQGTPLERLHVASFQIAHDISPVHNDSLLEFVQHAIRAMKADLRYPIILGPGNAILDGRHRIIKALVTNRTWLGCYRLTADDLEGIESRNDEED